MPISLKVGSEFDERSAREARADAERYYQRQSTELKVKAQLDDSSTRAAAQEAERKFTTAGRDAGTGFSRGLNQGVDQAFSNYTARFGQMGQTASNTFSGISSSAKLGALGVAGVGVAVAGVVGELYKLGAQWDDIGDSITMRTGRMGADVKALTDLVGDIGRSTAAPLGSIGDIVGQLAQSMPDLTANSAAIHAMGSNLAYLNENGESVNIRELGMAFNVFGVSVSNQVRALDDLSRVSRSTGIPINDLISTVRQGAPQFKQFGLDIGSATGLLATFSRAGLDPTTTVTGLRTALKNVGDDARGAGPALADVVTKIKEFHDASNEPAARGLAEQFFGAKNFAPFLEAIESGTLDAKQFKNAMDEVGPSIASMADATDDGAQGLQKLWNTIQTKLGPAASFVFGAINTNVQAATGNMNDLQGATSKLADRLTELGGVKIPPDSALGQLLTPSALREPGTPGAAAGPGLPTTKPATPTTGLAPNFYKDWYKTPEELKREAAETKAATGPGPGQAQVPYGPGYGAPPQPGTTTSVYNAQQALIEAQHSVAESSAQLARVQADGKHTTDDLTKASNDLAKAKGDEVQAQMRLQDAYTSASKKVETASAAMQSFGVALDKDFGLSKGLPGLAENLVRFLGNLAAAPLLGPLNAISAAQGGIDKTGSGLMGILAAQGAFGPQYTPAGMAAAAADGGSNSTGNSPSASGSPGGNSAGVSPSNSGSAAPAGSNEQIVHQAMLAQGWPESEWPALKQLVMHESGFRNVPNAAGSGAYGMFQFMPYTWGTYGTGAKTDDPGLQAQYGMQYIAGRYGSPSAAWGQYYNHPNHEGSYDEGGWLQPGTTIAQNNTGRPEQVLPPSAAGIGKNAFGQTPSVTPGQPAVTGPASTGPSPIGGKAQEAGAGMSSSNASGGLIGGAVSAASMAADMFAPGSGAAVQIAGQEIERAIKFGAQAAGIGVGGLMQTFLPTGASDLANNNWITRIAGGIASVAPQIPNLAGKSASVDAMNEHGKTAPPSEMPPPISSGRDGGPALGSTVNVTVDNSRVHDIQSDVTHHQTQTGVMPGQR